MPRKLFPKQNKGSLFSTEFFSVRILRPNKEEITQASFRGAVVVSKKVAKTAVQRNQIRRKIYEILRSLKERFPKRAIVVVYVRIPALKASSNVLRKSLEGLSI